MTEETSPYITKPTAQLVHEAADTLLRQGRGHEITTRNILEIIGQGSTTTIQKALDSWWNAAGAHLTQLEGFFELPDEVATPLMDAIKAIQDTASHHALKAYDAQIATIQSEMEQLTLARDEAIQAQQQALGEIETLNETITEFKAEVSRLEKDLEREAGRRESLEAQVEEIRKDANDKVAKAEAKTDDVRQQLNDAHEQVKQAEQRHDDTEKRLAKQLDEQKTLREKIARDSSKEIEQLRDLLNASNDKVHALQVATSRDQAMIEAQKISMSALESQKRALEQELKEKVVECARLDATVENTQAEAKAVSEQKTMLVSELEQFKHQYHALAVENEVLKRELETLKKKAAKRGGDK